MGNFGTQVQIQVQNQGKTGCKSNPALVQIQVQNRGKTRVNVPPYNPMVVSPFLLVGQPQSRTTSSPAEVRNVFGRLPHDVPTRSVWLTAAMVAPARKRAACARIGYRKSAPPSLQNFQSHSVDHRPGSQDFPLAA